MSKSPVVATKSPHVWPVRVSTSRPSCLSGAEGLSGDGGGVEASTDHAGGTGTVVSVGDPDTDGPEYIKVKVTLNGTRDTLPFAPEDLASTSRSPKAAEANGSTPPPVSTAPPPPAPPPPAAPPSTKATRRPPRSGNHTTPRQKMIEVLAAAG
jgi:hypothetical protein